MSGRSPKLDGRTARGGARALVVDALEKADLAGIKVPRTLGKPGKECWGRVMAQLVPKGHVGLIDLPAIEMMCRQYEIWKLAEARIIALEKDEEGAGDFWVSPNGYKQFSADRNLASQAMKNYLTLAREFGGTTVSRIRTTGAGQGDLFAFLQPEGRGSETDPEEDGATTEDTASAGAVDPTDPFGPPPSVLN